MKAIIRWLFRWIFRRVPPAYIAQSLFEPADAFALERLPHCDWWMLFKVVKIEDVFCMAKPVEWIPAHFATPWDAELWLNSHGLTLCGTFSEHLLKYPNQK